MKKGSGIMRFLICEDDRAGAEKVRRIMEDKRLLHEDDTLSLTSPQELLMDVEEGLLKECDVLITDIHFPEVDYNGIEIACKINKSYPMCVIIFISNYASYTEAVYDVEHAYFIRKKNLEVTLPNAVMKARRVREEDSRERILQILVDRSPVSIVIRDIICICRSGRKINIVTVNGEYSCNDSLKSISSRTDSRALVRINGSSIINLNHISEHHVDKVIMKDRKVFYKSGIFRKSFEDCWLRFLENRI